MYIPVCIDEQFLLMMRVSHDTTHCLNFRYLVPGTYYTLLLVLIITRYISRHSCLLQVHGTRCTVVQAVDRAVSCLNVSRRLPVQYNSSSCSCFCTYSVLARRFNWLPRCQRWGTRVTYARRISHPRVCTRFTPLPHDTAA